MSKLAAKLYSERDVNSAVKTKPLNPFAVDRKADDQSEKMSARVTVQNQASA